MKRRTVILDKPGKKELVVNFEKENEEVEILGVVMGEEKGKYELDVVVDHKVGKNKGRIEIRGIAKNGADVVVRGLIKIEKQAHLVEDFLEMRLLVLDDGARAEALPILEIEADNVKVSHAASVGRLDEEQVYYLMSRGIEREKAEEMLIGGFLSDLKGKMT